MSKPVKTVVPPQDADQLSAWIRVLLTRGRELSSAECDAVIGLGQAAVPGLLAVLGDFDLALEDGPGDGRGPLRATRLLGTLRAEAAIGPMVDLLLECDAMEMLYSALIFALQEMGEPAVGPLLAALPAELLSQRVAIAEVLSHLGVGDARILAALTALLQEDAEMGASFLTAYGDPAALPLLLHALDNYELRREKVSVLGDQAIVELAEAIKELGGTFTESQVRKLRRADTWRDEARDAVIEKNRVAAEEVSGGAKPGRNEPCWCGSDRKYKKCHLVSDEQAIR